MDAALAEACRQILGSDIIHWERVLGGDINLAFQFSTTEASYFVKQNQTSDSLDIIQKEIIGLEKLRQSQTILTPEVIGHGQIDSGAFLILPFVEKGIRTDPFWESFGMQLAQLHACTAPQFGFEVDNYIGAIPQHNSYTSNWPTFYKVNRLEPLAKETYDKHLLGQEELMYLDTIYKKLDQILPNEPPALIHGDLWSGNFICTTESDVLLIDPATHYGHREMDLAMSRLFGGFDRQFYSAYEEVFPLEPGFDQRIDLYKLYYLLVHLTIFGSAYFSNIARILKKYN